jgi:hypothetical protein
MEAAAQLKTFGPRGAAEQQTELQRAAGWAAEQPAAEQLKKLQSSWMGCRATRLDQLEELQSSCMEQKLPTKITKQMPTKITQIPQQTTNNRTAEGER